MAGSTIDRVSVPGGARILAEAEAEAGDHDAAVRWYLRVLEQDAYNEPAHSSLVAAMEAAGRHGTASRLYRIYVARMTELAVEPAALPTLSGRARSMG